MIAIQDFIQLHEAVTGLLILGVMFVEFARERYPVAVVSVLGACAFLALGLLEPICSCSLPRGPGRA